jgi:hypothetical protein
MTTHNHDILMAINSRIINGRSGGAKQLNADYKALVKARDEIIKMREAQLQNARSIEAQTKQEPVAWLCGRSNGDTFALTVKQLRELGYGNISMPPFKKLAPLFTALAQQEMAHDRMMDDALTIGSAWVRDGKRLEPTSVYKSMEEDA